MKAEKLQKILSDHALYQESGGKEGAIAILCRANLVGIELVGANFSFTNLSFANFRGANLSGAKMIRAELVGTNLIGTNLSGAELMQANLSGAKMIRTDLRGANLRNACLRETRLKDADLRGADLRNACLSGADLSGTEIDFSIEDGLLRKVALKILRDRESFNNEVWHNSCNTIHCIAGYACLMAEDRKIEGEYGTEVAGLLLLGIKAHSHFFDSNKAAIGWLERVVERTA